MNVLNKSKRSGTKEKRACLNTHQLHEFDFPRKLNVVDSQEAFVHRRCRVDGRGVSIINAPGGREVNVGVDEQGNIWSDSG